MGEIKNEENEKNQENMEDIELVSDGEEGKSSFDKKSEESVIQELKEKLKICGKERQEYLEGWQRAKADFINARRDEEKAKVEFRKFANEDVLLQILPVLDSFEVAFSNKAAWEETPKEWRNGVEYIHAQLKKVLEKNGFSELRPLGESFNPLLHESVELVKTDQKGEDGVILEVAQSGYTLHGKVVRGARVKVGRFGEKSQES